MSINTTITFMNELTMAQRILLCRRDLDWKQEELSAKSGISRTYISEVERGQITNVGIEVIEALAKALGVSPSYLIGWEEYDRLKSEKEKAYQDAVNSISDTDIKLKYNSVYNTNTAIPNQTVSDDYVTAFKLDQVIS